ncbi:MAG: hypothetical protein IJW36_03135 [Clostridia bacterium]|nr:hypothetical protein [Clostridia bacterium]
MTLKDLTTEEIKEILTKLLYRTEPSKEVVDRHIMYRRVYQFNGKYCINYEDGFDYKVCSIDNINAHITSESLNDNILLTEYYHEILKEVYAKKEAELAMNA